MEGAHAKLSTKNSNHSTFIHLVLVVPARYMAHIFTWLYEGGSQSLSEFFSTKNVSLKKIFDHDEQEKIRDGTDPFSMDVTLLYKLLAHACDISKDPLWYKQVEEGQELSLGQILDKIKKVRNKRLHENPNKLNKETDEDMATLAMEQKCLLTQMLTLAGQKAGKSQDTVNKAVSSMEADLDERNITVKEFVSKANMELSQKNNQNCSHFNYVEPLLVVKTHDALMDSEVRLRDLFRITFQEGSRPQVIHVTGEAGAGKTSLCQAVFSGWLKKEQRTHGTAAYQLVLSIACARVTTKNLHYYLRSWALPETTKFCRDTASLTRVLQEVRILWLVDGWDEATVEARGLLHEILHSKPEGHTVLVTCRPEFNASLTKLFVGNVLNVSLAGLDSEKKKEFVNGMNLNYETVQKFFRRLQNFPSEGKEFNNPLKFQLLVELWSRPQFIKEERRLPSVVQMYVHRTQWQRDDLIEGCEADVATDMDVAGKVDAWLRLLYEVSFHSTKSSASLILDAKNVNVLSEECGVSAKRCLSTFLDGVPATDGSSHSTSYTFFHDSQRCFFAARHLECCCEDAPNAEDKISKTVHAALRDNQLSSYLTMSDLIVQFMLIIKILLSRLTRGWICREASLEDLREVICNLKRKFLHLAKGIQVRRVKAKIVKVRLIPVMLAVMDMWASGLFQANVSARFLTDMLAKLLEWDRDPTRWLEVVRRCGYCDELVKEVSRKVSTKMWEIHDRDVSAATLLLKHVTPATVKVVVSVDPKKLTDLPDLLSLLADRPVTLELHLLLHYYRLKYNYSSDKYLALVCKEGSRCSLRSFSGHLSPSGLSTLTAAPYLYSLSLRITRPLAVQELVEVTQQLPRISNLSVIYDNVHFVAPRSALDAYMGVVLKNGSKYILTPTNIRALTINLFLPHLRDSSVNYAVKFIYVLSKSYKTITANKLDPLIFKRFCATLRKKAVTVGKYRKRVYVKEKRRTLSLAKS